MDDGAVVRLERISTIYEGEKIPAIIDIDLDIRSGDFVCIVGPNGAGKTTLLETINGILRHTSGGGSVLGEDLVRRARAARRRIGYVIQNFEIDPLAPFLCRDAVMSGRVGKIGLLRYPGEEDWKKARDALAAVGMAAFMERPVGKLSGGEFQKVLLARAMAQEPDIFLLDEPFANLDMRSRSHIEKLISQLNETGATVLMVSHDLSAIPEACTHIIVMDRGRVIGSGKRDEIIRSGILDRLMPSKVTPY